MLQSASAPPPLLLRPGQPLVAVREAGPRGEGREGEEGAGEEAQGGERAQGQGKEQGSYCILCLQIL